MAIPCRCACRRRCCRRRPFLSAAIVGCLFKSKCCTTEAFSATPFMVAQIASSPPLLLPSIVPVVPVPSRLRRHFPQRAGEGRASSTQLKLMKGMVSSVDDEIMREEADARRSPFEKFAELIKASAKSEKPLDTFKREIKGFVAWQKAQMGDTETKQQLLRDERVYANEELLDKDHVGVPPVLDDLNQQPIDTKSTYWVRAPFRIFVFVGAFFFFPYFSGFWKIVLEISDSEYEIINNQFAPSIGILYGTFVALTLEILYRRQGNVQENSTLEASLLSQVTQNILSLFRDDPAVAREASQIVADQVRIIANRSRGAEMLIIMRADPYARILSLVDRYHKKQGDYVSSHEETLIECLRGEIPALMEARARRLCDEASALPPTHFLVLTLLTCLSLIGFTAGTLSIQDEFGRPPREAALVFAGVTALYVLFFNFCKDLNNPFAGVYQIKRSSAASYLLQIKWLIANQPFGREVSFERPGFRQTFDSPDMACEEECVIECLDDDEFCESNPEVSDLVAKSYGIPTAMMAAEYGEVSTAQDFGFARPSPNNGGLNLTEGTSDVKENTAAVRETGLLQFTPTFNSEEVPTGDSGYLADATEDNCNIDEPTNCEVDPRVLYFRGTSGLGANIQVEQIKDATEILTAQEESRRNALFGHRLELGDDWENLHLECDIDNMECEEQYRSEEAEKLMLKMQKAEETLQKLMADVAEQCMEEEEAKRAIAEAEFKLQQRKNALAEAEAMDLVRQTYYERTHHPAKRRRRRKGRKRGRMRR